MRTRHSQRDSFISQSYKRDPIGTVYFTSLYEFSQNKKNMKKFDKVKNSIGSKITDRSIDSSRMRFLMTSEFG